MNSKHKVLAFLLLLSLWPFHHKPKPQPGHPEVCGGACMLAPFLADEISRGDGQIDQSKSGPIGECGATLEDCISPNDHKAYGRNDGGWLIIQQTAGGSCESTGGPWFYINDDDNVIGIGASCEAAKKDYETMHIDPVRMSRS